MSSILNILPALAFLLILLSISAYIQRTSKENRQKDFAKDYFIGGRTLGGFVLAMTTAATYSSVSTFVGGRYRLWLAVHGHRTGSRYLPRLGRVRQKNCPHCA